LHQLLGPLVVLGHDLDVRVVLRHAFVQPGDLAEQVADDGVGVARQVLQALAVPAAHGGGLERQHDAEPAEQAADAVERGGALFDKPLASAVHHQARLLVEVLDRHKAHVRALDGLADGGGVGRVVLAALAHHAVGRDKLRGDQPHAVAPGQEQPRPVVGARAGLHANDAGRQRRNQLVQLVARHGRSHQLDLAGLVDAVNRENVLGEVDTHGQNRHEPPLPNELMRDCTSHRGTWLPFAATRLVRDGEVSFIR